MKFDLLGDLNPEQREAALCKSHCLVVAAPGSGKTKMLAAKAAFLLSDGVATVAAVTFTRASALELKDRIIRQAGPSASPRLLVGTFHSINQRMAFPARSNTKSTAMGKSIIDSMTSPFRKPWNIAPTGELMSHVFNAIREAGLDIDYREAIRIIELSKGEKKSPKEPREARLVEVYADALKRRGQIDMQDILLLTNEAMVSGALKPMPVNYLLLDEYQDTDQIQFEWAAMHAIAGTSVTCVGDDDQSIYGFRRALGNLGMDMFLKQFKATRIILGTNYRSRAEVLAAGGSLIEHNLARVDKSLISHKGVGGEVVWDMFQTRVSEAGACVEHTKLQLGKKLSCAVIARTNRRLDLVEAQMIACEVSYQRTDKKSVLDSMEFILYRALVECIIKPTANAIDLLLGWAGVSEDDKREIHGPLRDRSTDLTKEGKSKWKLLVKRVSEWKLLAEAENYDLLFSATHSWLVGYAKTKLQISLFEVVGLMLKPKANQSMTERLASVSKAAQQKSNDKEAHEASTVSLITAHGSKGLEYDFVWIVGAEEKTFPDETASLEEERRLMYVAMTRARERFVVSAAGSGNTPSRFIVEARLPRAVPDRFVPGFL